ncbi:hypothetical protein [Meiothermus rufus]|uniref:hypothetical protein n=1 Tax=Meiothermus rufus TaxID=604332 RepID=UPI000405006F|nr:hypothetical protein [Meiothermus rufus]
MDFLVAALLLGLAVYFLFRVVRGLLPSRWLTRFQPTLRLRCPVCQERLNPAEVAALRQARRRCREMTRCPYQRSRWLN